MDEKLTAAGGKNDTTSCTKDRLGNRMRLRAQTPDAGASNVVAGKTYTALQFLRLQQIRARAFGLKTSCAPRTWHRRSRVADRGTTIAEQQTA